MEILKFNQSDIHRHLRHEMGIFKGVKSAIKYVTQYMHENTVVLETLENIDLNKVSTVELKNYNWLNVMYKDVQILIRSYNQHHTLFIKNVECREMTFSDGTLHKYSDTTLSIVTFNTDTKNMDDGDMDEFWNNPYLDLNKCMKQLIEIAQETNIHTLWNPRSFTRPERCEIKIACPDTHSVSSYDTLFLALEEISSFHHIMYAQNTMMEMLKNIEVGTKLGRDEILEVFGPEENFVADENTYYHGYGVKTTSQSFIHDVYSLTRYNLDSILELFPKE